MTQMNLADADVSAMLRIATAARSTSEAEPLPWDLLHDLRELIRCDALVVSGQDTPAKTAFAEQMVGELGPEPPVELFWEHYWDSLDCSYPDRSGDLSSITMTSDFYSDRALHDLGMYVDYSGPMRIEREIMVCLPAGPGRTLRLLFSRGAGADFTERDRALLTLLRPHLQAAYVAAERRRAGLTPLTARQQAVLQYVAAGLTNRQIARRLDVTEATIGKHLENIFARLGVNSRTAAVAHLPQD